VPKPAAPSRVIDVERRNGVAVWRQIADRIRLGIADGSLGAGGRLPPEVELAARFGVNRHTVRTAIAALMQEGLLRAEQGRGTFVASRRKVSYAIAPRTRFSAGLRGQAGAPRSNLLAHATEEAPGRVAEALDLRPGAAVLRLETLSAADGFPLTRSTAWFDAGRFAGFAEAFAECGSITLTFRRFGVDDYLRRSTVISARHADVDDIADLRLAPGAIVLVAAGVNVDLDGRPIQYAETRFPADRVDLTVTTAEADGGPLR